MPDDPYDPTDIEGLTEEQFIKKFQRIEKAVQKMSQTASKKIASGIEGIADSISQGDIDKLGKSIAGVIEGGIKGIGGKKIGDQLDKVVTHPAAQMAIAIGKITWKMFKDHQKALDETHKVILSTSYALGDFNVSLEKETKSTFQAIVKGAKLLGEEEEEVRKRIGSMRLAGFKSEEASSQDLWALSLGTSKALSLTSAEVGKFSKTLRTEYKMGLTDSQVTLFKLSKQLKGYNITNKERIEILSDLMKKGQDFGLGIKEIGVYFDDAAKRGLSFAQAQRQVEALTTGVRQMDYGKQAFLAQQMGLGGNVYEQIAQVQGIMKDLRTGKPITDQGRGMMESIARLAGLGERPKGGYERGEPIQFAMFAKTYGLDPETAKTWALGGKMIKQQVDSLKDVPGSTKEYNIATKEAVKEFSVARSDLKKTSDALSAWYKQIILISGNTVELNETIKQFDETIKKEEEKRAAERTATVREMRRTGSVSMPGLGAMPTFISGKKEEVIKGKLELEITGESIQSKVEQIDYERKNKIQEQD